MTNGFLDTGRPIGNAVAVPLVTGDSAANTSLLAACTGFLFSARSIFGLVSGRWLNAGSEPGVTSSFVASSALIVAALVSAIGYSAHPLKFLLRASPVRWVLAYLAFAGCSLLWTAAASPESSALYWVSLAGDVALVVLLFRAFPPESTVHGLLTGFIAGSLVLSAAAWIMPAASDLRLGDLEYFNTNQIANLCALSILISRVVARRGSTLWRLSTIFLAFTLLRSLSKGTIIAFAAAQAYLLLRDAAISRREKWVIISGAIVAIASSWTLLDAYYGVYTTAGNQAETLTGRTAIWLWSIDAALRHPWIGNGFDAMWKVAPLFGGSDLFEARHAENEILQQFFAYGVCGIALLSGVYGSLCRSARRVPHGPMRTVSISILIYVIVRGAAEAEPFDLLLPLWLIAALALMIHVRMEAPGGTGAPDCCRGSL